MNKKVKALFLDRDGIINVDHGYVSCINDFEFTEGIFELIHLFTQKGYLIFVVTNQSGIGHGYFSLESFKMLTTWMMTQFKKKGITLNEILYCPHTPESHCDCRKPKIGMIHTILESYPIDLEHSWLIGDKQSDIDLARNAHIGRSIAIGNKSIQGSTFTFKSVLQCKEFLIKNCEFHIC
jgi:D-glycero-D-manno-heptose 1,7-bisphosphate phosphatase